jgi:hypothetical protein
MEQVFFLLQKGRRGEEKLKSGLLMKKSLRYNEKGGVNW